MRRTRKKQRGQTGGSPFLDAIRENNLEHVRNFLARVDPSENDQYAIRFAIEYGRTEIVKLLLADPRVDPSANDQYAIRFASKSDRTEIVKLLLADPRVDPSANNQEAIEMACREGSTEIVKLLLADPRVDPSDTECFREAIEFGQTEIVKLLLADPRADPSANNQKAIRFAIDYGQTEIVKLLLADPRVDPSDTECFREAIEFGQTESVKLLLADPRVDPSAKNQEAILFASGAGYTEIVKLLLADPRVNIYRPIFVYAARGEFEPSINALILSLDPATTAKAPTAPTALWEGFTNGDIEKFDSIFTEDANDYSCCPVCLRYVSRTDGCMYMSHNCVDEAGTSTVNMKLYNRYKNPEGIVYWCTICGRICLGHRHYALGGPNETLELLRPVESDPFAKDCTREGGGGMKEKLMRFHAFRQLAVLLQKKIGKLSHQEAMEKLLTAMWLGPIHPSTIELAEENLESKKFAISANVFPKPVVKNIANIPRNARNTELIPTVAPGYNAISTDQDEHAIQFHHRMADGTINHHQGPPGTIGADSFASYIQSNLSDGKAGPCWQPSCTAKIHPDEIRVLVDLGVFPKDLYTRYKEAFNVLQKGGRGPLIQEAALAECVIWRHATRQSKRNRKAKTKTKTKNRTKRRSSMRTQHLK